MSEKLDLIGLTHFKYRLDEEYAGAEHTHSQYATKEELENAGKVKTVNDAEPDENGNIDIEVNDPDVPIQDVEDLFKDDDTTGEDEVAEFYTKEEIDSMIADVSKVKSVDTIEPDTDGNIQLNALTEADIYSYEAEEIIRVKEVIIPLGTSTAESQFYNIVDFIDKNNYDEYLVSKFKFWFTNENAQSVESYHFNEYSEYSIDTVFELECDGNHNYIDNTYNINLYDIEVLPSDPLTMHVELYIKDANIKESGHVLNTTSYKTEVCPLDWYNRSSFNSLFTLIMHDNKEITFYDSYGSTSDPLYAALYPGLQAGVKINSIVERFENDFCSGWERIEEAKIRSFPNIINDDLDFVPISEIAYPVTLGTHLEICGSIYSKTFHVSNKKFVGDNLYVDGLKFEKLILERATEVHIECIELDNYHGVWIRCDSVEIFDEDGNFVDTVQFISPCKIVYNDVGYYAAIMKIPQGLDITKDFSIKFTVG